MDRDRNQHSDPSGAPVDSCGSMPTHNFMRNPFLIVIESIGARKYPCALVWIHIPTLDLNPCARFYSGGWSWSWITSEWSVCRFVRRLGMCFADFRTLRVYAFNFAVTVRLRAREARARAQKKLNPEKKSEIKNNQLTLREKVGFWRMGISIAAAGENFDEFESRNVISLWEIDNLRVWFLKM